MLPPGAAVGWDLSASNAVLLLWANSCKCHDSWVALAYDGSSAMRCDAMKCHELVLRSVVLEVYHWSSSEYSSDSAIPYL